VPHEVEPDAADLDGAGGVAAAVELPTARMARTRETSSATENGFVT